jgi:alkanesulfonate monooxygenase SsuD/methylene tetrahydromethanopterin reductase-like flavin-dependent oxidoreductase (luciferase family)
LAPVPLSVLDLAPVAAGSTPADALRNSLDLARHAERLGYHRYWVAEHHNMPGIASSAPAVLIGHIADVTSTIRVGSGGVMLPNHAPLVVAEQFGMLEAFHRGRIDLGIGRAPGTDGLTASALRGTPELSADNFPRDLISLMAFFDGQFPPEHPYSQITAVPARGYTPAVWLLGSSDYSAQVAAYLGLPFAAAAVCAESDERARWLALPGALSFLRLRSGRPGLLPTPEEAAAYPYTPIEQAFIDKRQAHQIIGSPDTVARGFRELLDQTQADELMLTTIVHDHADRLRSYELVATEVAPKLQGSWMAGAG